MIGALALLSLFGCTVEDPPEDDDAGSTTAVSTTTTSDTTTGDDTTSDTADTADTTTETGGDSLETGFLDDFDVFSPQGDCDPYAQDCAEGEKCVPYSSDGSSTWNANKCVPILDNGQIGEECVWDGIVEATDSCGADSICWDVMDIDGVYVGTCTPMCLGTPEDPMCPEGSSCLITNEGTINICLFNCDPLQQDCEDGEGCFWNNNGFSCIFTAGEIPIDEPCSFVNDCFPGGVCLDAAYLPSCNGASCCAAWCDLNDPVCAIAGTECVAWFNPGDELPGYENVGVCILPG